MDKTDIKDDSENITLRVHDSSGDEMFFKVCNLYDDNDCFISSIRYVISLFINLGKEEYNNEKGI
jgi:hypothetical protein